MKKNKNEKRIEMNNILIGCYRKNSNFGKSYYGAFNRQKAKDIILEKTNIFSSLELGKISSKKMKPILSSILYRHYITKGI